MGKSKNKTLRGTVGVVFMDAHVADEERSPIEMLQRVLQVLTRELVSFLNSEPRNFFVNDSAWESLDERCRRELLTHSVESLTQLEYFFRPGSSVLHRLAQDVI